MEMKMLHQEDLKKQLTSRTYQLKYLRTKKLTFFERWQKLSHSWNQTFLSFRLFKILHTRLPSITRATLTPLLALLSLRTLEWMRVDFREKLWIGNVLHIKKPAGKNRQNTADVQSVDRKPNAISCLKSMSLPRFQNQLRKRLELRWNRRDAAGARQTRRIFLSRLAYTFS